MTNPIIRYDGAQIYMDDDGKRHRIDGPAFIGYDGTKEYWENGKRHRIGGPARINADGTQFYYENNKLHRIDGPAVIYLNGTIFCVNNKRHRIGGPAYIDHKNRYKEYWIDGNEVTELEHDLLYDLMKLKGLI